MADDPDKKGSFFKDYVKAESMVQLAIAIPAGCLIGWLLGSWLDRHFHQAGSPSPASSLGAVGGFIQMICHRIPLSEERPISELDATMNLTNEQLSRFRQLLRRRLQAHHLERAAPGPDRARHRRPAAVVEAGLADARCCWPSAASSPAPACLSGCA